MRGEKKRLGNRSASRSPGGESLDSLQPISPCLNKKAGDGRVLSRLHRPDFEMAHAFTTADEQPLWIRHKAAVEEAEIHMGSKHGEVENGVARSGRAVPDGIARDDFMSKRGSRGDESAESLDDRSFLSGEALKPGSNWFSWCVDVHAQNISHQARHRYALVKAHDLRNELVCKSWATPEYAPRLRRRKRELELIEDARSGGWLQEVG
jgi:hypothetical protein